MQRSAGGQGRHVLAHGLQARDRAREGAGAPTRSSSGNLLILFTALCSGGSRRQLRAQLLAACPELTRGPQVAGRSLHRHTGTASAADGLGLGHLQHGGWVGREWGVGGHRRCPHGRALRAAQSSAARAALLAAVLRHHGCRNGRSRPGATQPLGLGEADAPAAAGTRRAHTSLCCSARGQCGHRHRPSCPISPTPRTRAAPATRLDMACILLLGRLGDSVGVHGMPQRAGERQGGLPAACHHGDGARYAQAELAPALSCCSFLRCNCLRWSCTRLRRGARRPLGRPARAAATGAAPCMAPAKVQPHYNGRGSKLLWCCDPCACTFIKTRWVRVACQAEF